MIAVGWCWRRSADCLIGPGRLITQVGGWEGRGRWAGRRVTSWIDESCKLTLVPRVGPRGLCDVFGREDMGYESYWAEKGANHRDWAEKGANGYAVALVLGTWPEPIVRALCRVIGEF